MIIADMVTSAFHTPKKSGKVIDLLKKKNEMNDNLAQASGGIISTSKTHGWGRTHRQSQKTLAMEEGENLHF